MEKYVVPSTTFSVSEQATPISSEDTSGSVGTFTTTFPPPERGEDRPTVFGPWVLSGRPFVFESVPHGVLTGLVNDVQPSETQGLVTVSGTTVLGPLNVYNVQAKPFSGTLGDAFTYYCGLAGVTGAVVDAPAAGRKVVFPGWNGELWHHLKMLAAATDTEVTFQGNVPRLRPIRGRTLPVEWRTDAGGQLSTGSLAQQVEVVSYGSKWVDLKPVYPAGGVWTPEVEILTVGPDEVVEHELELSASLYYVEQPYCREFVGQYDNAESVYTVVGDDGFPIHPRQWYESGGGLTVSINDDTSTLTVTLRGPVVPIYMSDGEKCETFSIALASDESGSRYSTLRLLGSGVVYNKETVVIPTGVPASRTGTLTGATIDNPFLQTMDDVYRAGVRAAKKFSGLALTETFTSAPALGVFQFGETAGSRSWIAGRAYRVRDVTYTEDSVSLTADDDHTYGDVVTGMTYGQFEDKVTGLSYGDVTVGISHVVD